MMTMRNRGTILAMSLLLVTCLGGCASEVRPESMDTWYVANPGVTPAAVGSVRREPVLIAYYASAKHKAIMDDLTRRRDEALARGDAAGAAALNEVGAASQDRAHAQLRGTASLSNIIDALSGDLPDIARETGVEAIVEEGVEIPGAPAPKDITDAVIRRLPKAE